MEDLLSQLAKAITSSRTSPKQVDLPIFKTNTTEEWLPDISNIKSEFE